MSHNISGGDINVMRPIGNGEKRGRCTPVICYTRSGKHFFDRNAEPEGLSPANREGPGFHIKPGLLPSCARFSV